MDWKHYAMLAGGAILAEAVAYIRSGKPRLFDPNNKYPTLDLVREAVRKELLDHFDPHPTGTHPPDA